MNHNNNLNAVRLIAAALVVIGHSFNLLGLAAPTWFYMACHSVAVTAFFVISGYLVAKSWSNDPSLPRFVVRRLVRIAPGLVGVVALSALVIGPVFTVLPIGAYFASPGFGSYFWNLALAPAYTLPGVFADGRPSVGVNGTLWSLPVEIAMYAGLLVYGRQQSQMCRMVLLPLALVGALAVAFWFQVMRPAQIEPVIWWNSVPFGLRFAGSFVIGAAVCVWRLERFLSVQVAVLLLMGTGLFLPYPSVTMALAMLVLPYAVLSFGLARSPVLGWAGGRADVSYGVYLWGAPVQQMLISVFGPAMHPLLLIATALPITLVVAYGSWRLIERPALQFKPRRERVLAAQPLLAR